MNTVLNLLAICALIVVAPLETCCTMQHLAVCET